MTSRQLRRKMHHADGPHLPIRGKVTLSRVQYLGREAEKRARLHERARDHALAKVAELEARIADATRTLDESGASRFLELEASGQNVEIVVL